MNHYELLCVDANASGDDIKRAYFRMVKKFTPEKDPVAFMSIRRAYEILSDGDARKKYDLTLSLYRDVPDKAIAAILESNDFLKKGLIDDAINALTNARLSEKAARNAISRELCVTYMAAGKPGKAVKIAEELAIRNPGEAKYHRLALMAYLNRGWIKKAVARKAALDRLDPGNEDNALPFHEDWPIMPTAIADEIVKAEMYGKKAPSLCFHQLLDSIRSAADNGDIDDEDPSGPFGNLFYGDKNMDAKMEIPRPYKQISLLDLTDDEDGGDLDDGDENGDDEYGDDEDRAPDGAENQATNQSQEQKNTQKGSRAINWNNPAGVAQKFAEHTDGIDDDKRERIIFYIESVLLKTIFNYDRYDILPHIDQAIKNLGCEYLFETPQYVNLLPGKTALDAVRAGMPKKLAALAMARVFCASDYCTETDKREYGHEAFLLECEIIADSSRCKPYLSRMKSEYGILYSFCAAFFDQIQRSAESKLFNEMERRIPKLKDYEQRMDFDWLGEDDGQDEDGDGYVSEPVRVVKVGRNEPCPCGSGKKYKKCCGAIGNYERE